jgi:hypothetical protein
MTDTAPVYTAARSAARPDPRLCAGITSVVIFLIGLILTNVLAPPGGPAGNSAQTGGLLPAFAVGHASAAVNSLGQALSAVALVVFAAALARTFDGWAAAQLTAFGALAAGTLLLSAACMDALTTITDPSAAKAVFQLSYLWGGSAHVAMLGALLGTSALAGRHSGRLPRWLSTFGLVAAAIGLLAIVNLGAPLLPFAFAYLIPTGRFLGFIYICLLVVRLRRS